MSGWISSKLKVAETFLQQIDQQAAESLGKSEKPQPGDGGDVVAARSAGIVPLKDQLKRRTPDADDFTGKLSNDPNFNILANRDRNYNKEIAKPQLPNKSVLTDGDWTELLNSSNQTAPSVSNRGNGASRIRGARKEGRKLGTPGSSNLSGFQGKRNQKINNRIPESIERLDVVSGRLSDGKPSNREGSSPELQSKGESKEGQEPDRRSTSSDRITESKHDGNREPNGVMDSTGIEGELHSWNVSQEVVPNCVDRSEFSASVLKSHLADKSEAAKGIPLNDNIKRRSSSSSDGRSDSELDSGTSTDSENEREKEVRKKRRGQIMAERVAEKAVEAIKERENTVARLEGEKESLEKIIEEQAKQQVQEASELQTNMMEIMEAVEKEKQKHDSTRMEILARLAKLETANADLAKSLASAQGNLEAEVSRVSALRQRMEVKQAAHEELKRRISKARQAGKSVNQLAASKGIEFEQEILEAEYSYITDKIERLQEKAKKLEADIEMTRKETENPTEVEIELKRRLGQLTDHLIQKQVQVESLSSEKATVQFRIEAVSRMLEENNSVLNMADVSTSSRFDIESGKWDLSKTKLRPLLADRIRSGGEHLESLLRQLDAIFSAGAVFLRRNSTARVWSVVYLVCLHLWVIYIFMSHSQTSHEARSGAVISLEKINDTAGV